MSWPSSPCPPWPGPATPAPLWGPWLLTVSWALSAAFTVEQGARLSSELPRAPGRGFRSHADISTAPGGQGARRAGRRREGSAARGPSLGRGSEPRKHEGTLGGSREYEAGPDGLASARAPGKGRRLPGARPGPSEPEVTRPSHPDTGRGPHLRERGRLAPLAQHNFGCVVAPPTASWVAQAAGTSKSPFVDRVGEQWPGGARGVGDALQGAAAWAGTCLGPQPSRLARPRGCGSGCGWPGTRPRPAISLSWGEAVGPFPLGKVPPPGVPQRRRWLPAPRGPHRPRGEVGTRPSETAVLCGRSLGGARGNTQEPTAIRHAFRANRHQPPRNPELSKAQ